MRITILFFYLSWGYSRGAQALVTVRVLGRRCVSFSFTGVYPRTTVTYGYNRVMGIKILTKRILMRVPSHTGLRPDIGYNLLLVDRVSRHM